MRGAIAQPYKVARAVAGAVMIDKVTFEHQKLLVPNMAMGLRRGAGGHAVQVKAGAKRPVDIQLQHLTVRHTV
jgi:hypothetical protein